MKKNLMFRRTLLLVLSSVMLSAVVTLGTYTVVTPRIFAQAKLQELYPRAQFLAEQAALFLKGRAREEGFPLLSGDTRQWDAFVWLVGADGAVLASTDVYLQPANGVQSPAFAEMLAGALEGTEQARVVRVESQDERGRRRAYDTLFISVPVVSEGRVEGAVIMTKSLEEIVSAMSSLQSSLWFSAMAVLGAMLPLVYWSTTVIIGPIRRMRDVALRMAGGDFAIRAQIHVSGEVGDLANAFNHLTSELGSTIADLTRERNQAMAIVNALSEGVLAVDGDCRPVQTNPALQRMLLRAGNGRMVPLPPEVWEAFRAALSENRPAGRHLRLGELLVDLSVTPVGERRPGVTSAIGVLRDETEAYRLEQTRRDYVANVSHELRTPLTALRALIEPLRDGLIRTDDKRRETYDIILRETMRLSRLVDDMLELSRLQSGSLALEKSPFPLEPLLRDTASIYAAKAADTGHVVVLDIPSPPLPAVTGNADRTEQVLVALLNNAFTYTPRGSRILIRAEALSDHVRVTVEDNGPGIKPEDLRHVFERFYKADKSHGGTGGTGLGLAISFELMTLLGETLTAENGEEGGARFMFTLHYA